MTYFIDVLLPIPVKHTFTYQVNETEAKFLQVGMRVSVPFGKRKLYAAIVISIHHEDPEIYEAKEIDCILDEQPLVLKSQLALWQWMSNYYMCTNGELLKAALPSALLLEGETVLIKNKEIEVDVTTLKDDEFLVYEALQFSSSLKIQELVKILNKKTVLPVAYALLKKKIITLEEYVVEKYTPKIQKWVKLHPNSTAEKLPIILEGLSNAPKQREVVLHYFTLSGKKDKVSTKELLELAKATTSTLNALAKKEILEVFEEQVDRVNFANMQSKGHYELNEHQKIAYQALQLAFEKKNVCLLHGVTSSGKTEIYSKFIKKELDANKQVLFLLPEIALTTQLIERLKVVFGTYLVVYHSRFSANERVEAWNRVLNSNGKPLLVVGVRSALFLPFQELGFIVIDEEHEQTYKQYDPAPRYHARDAAIVLAHSFKAKVLLGSATPSVETYANAQSGKYGLVTLNKRHKNILMPDIELVDLQIKYRKRLMKGHFSDRLLEEIQTSLDAKEQVILFQNRRGFSSIQTCNTCGYVPQCTQCDVSLTYHKYTKKLRCHYCGYQIAEQFECRACGSTQLLTKGLGTEQVEEELKGLFPKHVVDRMDQDTTRGKFGHQKIISKFEAQEIDILVGTQMLAKGLDFKNVNLVGVMNADGLLHFPDYRAHERTYQLLSQVAGRSGRFKKRGKVIIQSFNPLHQILQQVSVNDYTSMWKDQMQERKQYHYPPFCKLIKLTLRHRDYNKTNEAADWLAKALRNSFQKNVFGPEFPAVSRIRNQYNKNILLKIPPEQSISKTKSYLLKLIKTFESIKNYSGVRIIINVDTA
ncbi:replication restart helicase PriA [Aquimarina agarivorans]|uniref:replication restart helicase PriA n=1 Tax=Aquimarina agarivorans TaxID=980584 RepID=UPI000248F5DD|nr:primosomal protein N' [Aquimarina agarivorans]